MAVQRVRVTPAVLDWALRERGYSTQDLAASIRVPSSTIEAWLSGDEEPTVGQWSKLAKALRRPRSIFLLPEPPESSVPPALRTAVGRQSHDLRPDELLQVRRARRLQRYLSPLLSESGEAAQAIPQVPVRSSAEEAGQVLRRWLRVPLRTQLAWESGSQALRGWREALELRCVIVLQLQLGKDGMRGFSLLDDVVPVIGINTAETNEARIFTAMHELTHLASRAESACSFPPNAWRNSKSVERWCDAVAASILLPETAVKQEVERLLSSSRPPSDDLGLARRLASSFQTSLRASGLRLMELGLAADDLFQIIERTYPNRDRDKPGGGRGGGQPAPERRLGEIGYRASEVFLDALNSRQLTERDARDLLRLDGAELTELRSLVEMS